MKGMTRHVDADKVMRALKKGTITYTGTIPYVRLDAVQDVLEAFEREEDGCQYDCSYCHSDEEELADWYDTHDAIAGELRPGIVKSDICTCLAPGMNYCEVHDP
jgi:hypothetical protein